MRIFLKCTADGIYFRESSEPSGRQSDMYNDISDLLSLVFSVFLQWAQKETTMIARTEAMNGTEKNELPLNKGNLAIALLFPKRAQLLGEDRPAS